MSIHIRMKEASGGLRVGEEASVDAELAKFLHTQGKCWIVGGDPSDFEASGLACDEGEIPPAVLYPPPEAVTATVVKGEEV